MNPSRLLRLTLACGSLAVVLGSAAPVHAAGGDWPWWRGPDRSGISTETAWSPEGQAEALWKSNVGMGYSTVSIHDGRLFTQGHDKEFQEDFILCLDPLTGEEKWRHAFPAKTWNAGHGGGSLCTPSVDGGLVYALNREGNFFCLDAATGEVKWEQQLVEERGLKLPRWGFSASPMIFDDMIVLNVGIVLAVDKKGKEIWKSKTNYGDAYATPAEFEFGGKSCLAVFGGNGLAVLERKGGKELGFFEWKTRYDVNAATPVVMGDKIFISSGYNHGCAMVQLDKKGLNLLWESKVMRNQMSGCVFFGEHLYGMDDGTLKCLDLGGNEVWTKERVGQGCLLLAGDRLVVMGGRGDLIIAKATPEGYEELATKKVLEGGVYWTTPVLLDGLLYCRNSEGDMVCLDHRVKEGK